MTIVTCRILPRTTATQNQKGKRHVDIYGGPGSKTTRRVYSKTTL
jgi:hypothetical protein